MQYNSVSGMASYFFKHTKGLSQRLAEDIK